jgi:hypothetical protein
MRYYSDSKVSIAALGFFFLLVLGYAGFEARGVISGPKVAVSSQAAAVHDPLVTISGQADRITSLTLNGTAVPVTQDGAFDQQYLLSPGENTVTIEGKDEYGRCATQSVSYTYQPLTIMSTTTNIADATATSSASSSPIAVRTITNINATSSTTTVTRQP